MKTCRFLSFFPIAVVVLASSGFAGEATCANSGSYNKKDLRSSFGPIRDQGSKGWCYANSTADQLGYWLKKRTGLDTSAPATMVSANAISLDYNEQDRNGEYSRYLKTMKAFQDPNSSEGKELSKQYSLLNKKYSAARAAAFKENPKLSELDTRIKLLKSKADPFGMSRRSAESDFGDEMQVYDLEAQKEKELQKNPAYKQASAELSRFQNDYGDSFLVGDAGTLREKERGYPERAIQVALKNGVCLEKNVRSVAYKDNDLQNSEAIEIDNFIQSLDKYLKDKSTENLCEASRMGSRTFNIDIGSIMKVIKTTVNHSSPIGKLLEMSCVRQQFPKNNLPSPVSMLVHGPDDKKKIMDNIEVQLNKENPPQISLDAGIFFRSPKAGSLVPDPHAVLVVGKQWNCKKNQPEYIIRNSWGAKSCEKNRQRYRTLSLDDPRDIKIEIQYGSKDTPGVCQRSCQKCEFNDESRQLKCANRLQECLDRCDKNKIKAVQAVNGPAPYHCDKGYYIVPADVIRDTLSGSTHLE
jgi:hypothetical protein